MNSSERSINAGKRQLRRKSEEAIRLGVVATEFLEERLSPRQAHFEAIIELWEQLLPPDLYRHCKIVDITGSELKVLVDSSAYMNELRWCSSDLLEEFRQRCPRARIRTIKLTVG
jgi:hypothetical protein